MSATGLAAARVFHTARCFRAALVLDTAGRFAAANRLAAAITMPTMSAAVTATTVAARIAAAGVFTTTATTTTAQVHNAIEKLERMSVRSGGQIQHANR